MGRKLQRKGTYVYLWLICVDGWQKSTQYCNYPSIKNTYIKKRKKVLHFRPRYISVVGMFKAANV